MEGNRRTMTQLADRTLSLAARDTIYLTAATGGAAGALGKVLVDQVTQHLTNRPPKEEPPKIELSPGVERKWAKALPGGQS